MVLAQSLCVCLCTLHVSVVSRVRPRSMSAPSCESVSSLFLSSACRAEHICIDRTDCDRVQRSVIRIVNCWISEQFSRVRKSSRVRVHRHASSVHYVLHITKKETEQRVQFEGAAVESRQLWRWEGWKEEERKRGRGAGAHVSRRSCCAKRRLTDQRCEH